MVRCAATPINRARRGSQGSQRVTVRPCPSHRRTHRAARLVTNRALASRVPDTQWRRVPRGTSQSVPRRLPATFPHRNTDLEPVLGLPHNTSSHSCTATSHSRDLPDLRISRACLAITCLILDNPVCHHNSLNDLASQMSNSSTNNRTSPRHNNNDSRPNMYVAYYFLRCRQY